MSIGSLHILYISLRGQAHPEGSITTRRGHCAKNPSGKDQLYPDEMGEISNHQFKDLKVKPCALNLGFKKNGAAFDDFITGWTQYWNTKLVNLLIFVYLLNSGKNAIRPEPSKVFIRLLI